MGDFLRLTHPSLLAMLLAFSLTVPVAGSERDQMRQKFEALEPGESFVHAGLTLTLHQKNAGVERQDGWYEAVSTECGHRVLTPGQYNDATQRAPIAEGVELLVHTLGARTVEGAKFTATCWQRTDGDMPEGFARGAVEALGEGPQTERRRDPERQPVRL